MKIIEQSHEILAFNDISILETASRTFYKSENKIRRYAHLINGALRKAACVADDVF